MLPVFVTGKKPEAPSVQRAAETKLPSSERGMLLFVAALLALGTVAVVAMLGFGLGGTTKPKTPAHAPSPSTVVAVPPIPSPADPPSPSLSAASPSPSRSSTRRTPAPTATLLGALSSNLVFRYCQDANGGMPVPPSRGRGGWSCVSQRGHQDFTPTLVCQWHFQDSGAKAVIAAIGDPATWRCYT